MAYSVYMYGVLEMKKALAAEARRRRMAIVKKITEARRWWNAKRINRTTTYVCNSGFVRPPLPPYVFHVVKILSPQVGFGYQMQIGIRNEARWRSNAKLFCARCSTRAAGATPWREAWNRSCAAESAACSNDAASEIFKNSI